jgi:hypothetical protein
MKAPLSGWLGPFNAADGFTPTWSVSKTAAEYRADNAAELAAASLAVTAAVLEALIHAGAVEADKLRASLGNLVADLSPAERQQAYGHSLQLLLSVIGSHEPVPIIPN